MSSSQLESIFNTFPDGVIACDREEKIIRINAAALKLFGVASESFYRGTSYHQFLHSHKIGDEQPGAISLEPWLLSLVLEGEAATWLQQEHLVLRTHVGRKIYVNVRRLSVRDAPEHDVARVYVFHDITSHYRKVLHLQRVQQAISTLKEAIVRIPEHIDFAFPEETFLLSPPVLFVAQQLVDVIGQVLNCQHVSLLAFGSHAGHLHYAVGSGFTAEQEQYRRKVSGSFLPTDFVDETVLALLSANQEVILPADRLRLPPGFREDIGAKIYLLVPLFLDNQLSGGLVIARIGFDRTYQREETEIVKAVATEAMFVLEYLRYWYTGAETRARVLAQQELNRLIDEFLNLASHEMNTPLTVIKGNLQLAQRRLMALKCQRAEQPEGVSEDIERILDPLASAARSLSLHERQIQALIDDGCIRSNTLKLHLERCDLVALLREAVADQRRAAPDRSIILDIMPPGEVVPIIADAGRIAQVINNYLANALAYSPAGQPVTVQLKGEGAVARVSVHDEGPGIPLEEQGRIWERFYYAKGTTAQHKPDLSLGLGLHLCQAFIECHHGSVGVQSGPAHGTTFWFTLPIETSAGSSPRYPY